jgi:Type II secretion system (T2SS), protein F
MNSVVVVAMLAGAVVGCGVFIVVRGFLPAPPALSHALDVLHPAPSSAGFAPLAPPSSGLTALVRPPVAQLRLIGQTPERYVIEKMVFALFGLLFPAIFTEVLGLAGVRLHWYIPTFCSLACAVGLYFLADVSVRQKAAAAREEFRRAVATYLTLVGLVRYGGAGAVESLESAARVGDGWVFDRIRSALDDARYANEAPWTRLRQVSVEIGVPDLGDVGDIMGLAGDQGAQVYQTLLSRAQSLRVALRTKEQQRAATATTLLYIPTSLLLLVFLVLIGYPALSRIA